MAARTDLSKPSERRARILAEVIAAARAALCRQAERNAARQADAEDALQDACVEFLRYYEGPPGTAALRYLMLAVKHSAFAQSTCAAHKHASRIELTTTDALTPEESRVVVACGRSGPAEWAEHRAELRIIAGRLAELKPDQRTALLQLGLGHTYGEIAELQGWTYTKVNRCLTEGRTALRALARGESSAPIEG